MRIRTIKPEFWRSEDIAALSIEDRLLFIGLWSYVEDNGVGRDEPQLIQCDLYPLDPFTEASLRTHGGLMRLSQQGLITRYEGPDGRKYLQVNSWDKHQKINRPSKPRFPQYNAENCTLTEPSVSPHCTLTEGSLPEQGAGSREQGTGKNTPFSPPHETDDAESASAELVTVAADAAPATASAKPASKPSTGGSRTRPSWSGPERTRPPRRTPSRSTGSATTGPRSPARRAARPTGRPRGATGHAGARNKPTSRAEAPRRVPPPTTASTAGSTSLRASTPTTRQPASPA